MVDLLGVDGIVTSHRLVLMVECEASAIILWLVRMCGICLKFTRICEKSRPILVINDWLIFSPPQSPECLAHPLTLVGDLPTKTYNKVSWTWGIPWITMFFFKRPVNICKQCEHYRWNWGSLRLRNIRPSCKVVPRATPVTRLYIMIAILVGGLEHEFHFPQ